MLSSRTHSGGSVMAMDLMLKTFLTSREFNDIPDKNWSAISKLLPGTTPRQCQRRYEDLLKEESQSGSLPMSVSKTVPSNLQTKVNKSDVDSPEVKGSRPNSAKIKGVKSEKDGGGKTDTRPNSADQGYFAFSRSKIPNPVMVIHVCDEAKNLKQDFHCPRDLLIREMKYFAEYLSTDAQRWEEVDISVHCDVQIFDWLMKHVKRDTREINYTPKLEPTNVISILISSDFLKMDTLVQECIEFCHRNMSAIVATPCNMNCINDKLITRIADLFNHNEADDIKDRKDKFKSKLFAKKLEKLFDPNANNPCSPENAAMLYKCNVCKKVLSKTLEKLVPCLQSRMLIDKKGSLCYQHVRDTSWDVNEYLLELKSQKYDGQKVKTWREVYWRVWGTINYVTCGRCGEVFPCSELGHCRYHPEPPQFDNGSIGSSSTGVIGVHPCCNLKVLRFDPTQPNKGCKVRDHVVNLVVTAVLGEAASDGRLSDKQQVYEDLLAHKDAVCVPYQRLVSQAEEDVESDVFGLEEAVQQSRGDDGGIKLSGKDSSLSEAAAVTDLRPQPRLQALTIEREVSHDDEFGFGESDDEIGDEEEGGKPRRFRSSRKSRVMVDPQAILLDAPDFSTTKTRKWDSSRSMRWNQDAQREEDQRRMYEITNYLTRLRLNPDKIDKLKQREYAGGVYAKLEAQWKNSNLPPAKPGNAQFRNKPRLTQLVTK